MKNVKIRGKQCGIRTIYSQYIKLKKKEQERKDNKELINLLVMQE